MSQDAPEMSQTDEHESNAPSDALLRGLNEVQRDAVQHGEGPLLLFAGAGSGKTRVLTHRIAYLIAAHHVSPRHILAVTFTNKAAQEMKARIGRIVGENVARHLWVGTFHATCARLLREFGEKIGLSRDFVVYDDGDQMTLIRECLRDLDLDDQKFAPRAVLSHISRAKEKLITPEKWKEQFHGLFEEVCGKVYPLYQQKLRTNNALDFDDLLAETVRLMDTQPEVLERLQNRFRTILVDEYQDVNYVQYVFLKRLAMKHRNICVVGDEDQSVYGFRGADVELILRFESDYPDATVMKLEQNYRSTGMILEAAHAVVRHNRMRKDKKLWTARGEGGPLRKYEAANEQEEAVWIAQKIREEVNTGRRRLNDFAILYRTNAQSRILEESFLNWRVPYKIVGGLRFYERKEVKDIMAYLRVIHNPADSVSLRRILNVPARGIGNTTVSVLEEETNLAGGTFWETVQRAGELSQLQPRARTKLAEFATLIESLRRERDTITVTEITRRVLERTGYQKTLEEEQSVEAQSRLENVLELLNVTREFEAQTESPTLSAFLEQASLVADIDSLDSESEAVTMMTLHSAKGLEFPIVFMTGMEEGMFPHFRSRESDREMEEERRLCYVGITRAEDELYLTWASRRSQFGNVAYNAPSRFLKDIPFDLFGGGTAKSGRGPAVSGFDPDEDEWGEANNERQTIRREKPKLWQDAPKTPREQAKPSAEFKVGQKVKHVTFGTGVVLRVSGEGDNTQAEIAFPNVGVKKLLLAYANLEKVN
jgi:DNA helicase II / ATP-dependent DNA helicase PcrA